MKTHLSTAGEAYDVAPGTSTRLTDAVDRTFRVVLGRHWTTLGVWPS